MRLWGRDRFFRGGSPGRPITLEIEETDDDDLYRTRRWFGAEELHPKYRFPLPPGEYRVTLHFAEVRFVVEGERRFDIVLEDEPRLRGHEPLLAGFATAEALTFSVPVRDGILDVELVSRAGDAEIAALEIRR